MCACVCNNRHVSMYRQRHNVLHPQYCRMEREREHDSTFKCNPKKSNLILYLCLRLHSFIYSFLLTTSSPMYPFAAVEPGAVAGTSSSDEEDPMSSSTLPAPAEANGEKAAAAAAAAGEVWWWGCEDWEDVMAVVFFVDRAAALLLLPSAWSAAASVLSSVSLSSTSSSGSAAAWPRRTSGDRKVACVTNCDNGSPSLDSCEDTALAWDEVVVAATSAKPSANAMPPNPNGGGGDPLPLFLFWLPLFFRRRFEEEYMVEAEADVDAVPSDERRLATALWNRRIVVSAPEMFTRHWIDSQQLAGTRVNFSFFLFFSCFPLSKTTKEIDSPSLLSSLR